MAEGAGVLYPASAEQQAVVDALAFSDNVIVESVAGSGETSTCLCFARAHPSSRVLLLTFNKRLKEESRARVSVLGLCDTVEVHSYHSLGYKYYSERCARDLVEVVAQSVPPRRELPPYTHVLVDEAQDMTATTHAFLCKVLCDLRAQEGAKWRAPIFGVFGDRLQAVYGFMGSDVRFLAHAHCVLPPNGAPWRRLQLRVSYRLPGNVAHFLNDALLGLPGHIRPHKGAGAPVRYLKGCPWSISDFVACDVAVKVFGSAARAAVEIINATNAVKRRDNPRTGMGLPPYVALRGDNIIVPVPRSDATGGGEPALRALLNEEFSNFLSAQHGAVKRDGFLSALGAEALNSSAFRARPLRTPRRT